jgi:hypothetical protein
LRSHICPHDLQSAAVQILFTGAFVTLSLIRSATDGDASPLVGWAGAAAEAFEAINGPVMRY